jgi:hydroxymethylbilane synthase
MTRPLVIGSRGSKLALWQAEQARERLRTLNPQAEIRIEVIKTTGDVKQDPLSQIGGQGVFTKELEEALIDRRIDLAVHSLKDLPTILPDDLAIGAICEREDARDALVRGPGVQAESILNLPQGAVVGTSSQRRLSQLKALRPDVVVNDLRGNVDTRIRKLDEGQYDAVILACAGLVRLGLADRISARIPTSEMLPAVGQGAIGIEIRSDNEFAAAAVSKLDHRETRVACLVGAGEYEAIYSGMPPIGLGKAGALIPARGRLETARGRAGRATAASPARRADDEGDGSRKLGKTRVTGGP